MASITSIPLASDDGTCLLGTSKFMSEWYGWTRGPAPLSTLAVRAQCRALCLDAVVLPEPPGPVVLEEQPRDEHRKDKKKLSGLFKIPKSRPVTAVYSKMKQVVFPKNPKEPSKLDDLLAKGQPDINLQEWFNHILVRVESLARSLPHPGAAGHRRFKYGVKRDSKQYCKVDSLLITRKLRDEMRKEVENTLASMPEFENSPLAVFLFSFVTTSTMAQLARWKEIKDRNLPWKISGFFEKVLPLLSRGQITELRLVNVEITDNKAFKQLMILCYDHLISLECGLPSGKHLNTLVKYGDRLRHLKIEGRPSPLYAEVVTFAFFGLSVLKLRTKSREGTVKFALRSLRSIHLVKVVNSCQSLVLTSMAECSPALRSVKSNHKPIHLKPNYTHDLQVFAIEELFIEGRKLKHFLQQFYFDTVFPHVRHVHLMDIEFKALYADCILTNPNINGYTFYCHSLCEFRTQWLVHIYCKMIEKLTKVKFLAFKASNSMCYNVIWSLLHQFSQLKTFTLDHSAQSVTKMNNFRPVNNLFRLQSFCYRKMENSYYSKDTGLFLAQVLSISHNLRRLQLHITPANYYDLQYHIAALEVQLPVLEEFGVYVFDDADIYINDIIWVLDRFPSIQNLVVHVGSDNALQKLRWRLKHTHVRISPVPDVLFL